MTRSHLQARSTRIYSNNSVYSPSGMLMFRCSDKKLGWYIRKNLAELVSSDLYPASSSSSSGSLSLDQPESTVSDQSRRDSSSNQTIHVDTGGASTDRGQAIRLLFEPKGTGRNRAGDEWYLEDQMDMCVVCGRRGVVSSDSDDSGRASGKVNNQDSVSIGHASMELDNIETVGTGHRPTIHQKSDTNQTPTNKDCADNESQNRSQNERPLSDDPDEPDERIGLTLHHVVPYQYRREMPISFKSHGSHDVLAVCTLDHDYYEKFADEEKIKLVNRYDAPLSGRGWIKSPGHNKVRAAASALLRYRQDIPASRIEELQRTLMNHYNLSSEEGITSDVLKDALELKTMTKGADFRDHGQIVIQSIADEEGEDGFARFVRFWRQHFLDTMVPAHLSKRWSVDDPVNLVAGEYNPYRPEMDGS